jgi:hypothetical protein
MITRRTQINPAGSKSVLVLRASNRSAVKDTAFIAQEVLGSAVLGVM